MIDLTRDEILDRLRAYRVLCIDSPIGIDNSLPTVMALQSEGLVTAKLVQVDGQSVLEVRAVSLPAHQQIAEPCVFCGEPVYGPAPYGPPYDDDGYRHDRCSEAHYRGRDERR